MVYICEFELYESDGYVCAVPCNGMGEGTFGDGLEDAVESAADWLAAVVDDALMHGRTLPDISVGAAPSHGGRVIAIAVSRDLSDIPAMSAADAARELGVSSARVSQLISSGSLDSWKAGSRRMVSRASVEARAAEAPKPGRPKEPAAPASKCSPHARG